jgi:diguanylate cyclase (GGDEF)-like protein/PAS domain S-box-containing protein
VRDEIPLDVQPDEGAESEARLRRYHDLWSDADYGVVVLDHDIRVVWGNVTLERMLGVKLDEWKGREPYAFVHPDDDDRVLSSFEGLEAHTGRRGPAIYRLIRHDGLPVLVVLSGLNLLDDPDYACMALEIRDLDDQQRAQALANDEYAMLERLVHHQSLGDTLIDIARLVERHGNAGDCAISLLHDGVFHVAAAPNVDREFIEILDGTPARPGCRAMGEAVHRASEVVSPNLLDDPWWADVRPIIERHRYRSCWTVPILSSTNEGSIIGTIDFLRYQPGEPRLEQWALYVLGARLAGLAVERAQYVEALQHQATHDPLSGLLNRRAFVDGLTAMGAAEPRSVAVLFVDLDRFKVVNDTHGHELGDRVLCTVAERLDVLRREGAVVARIGGDEFVIAWPDVAIPGTATKLAERARALVAKPIEVGVVTIVPTASVGIAVGTLGRHKPEQLITDADAALYRAKASGRNRCVFFDEDLRASHLLRRGTEHDLGRALEHGELRAHYQPVLSLDTGEIVAVEALVRWEHPSRGLLLPSDFIGVAEDAGLIVEIDRWMLANALRQVAWWNERRAEPIHLWNNISAVHLARPDTVAVIRSAHAATPSVPFGIELTESAIHLDRDAAVSALSELRKSGVQIAIDDFGTGYSSLNALRAFPITHLKVDKGFVAGLLDDAHDRAIIEASIALARALDLTTTAEGIEAIEQAEVLRALGCHRGQGFTYCRPLAAEVVEERCGTSLEYSCDLRSGVWTAPHPTPAASR